MLIIPDGKLPFSYGFAMVCHDFTIIIGGVGDLTRVELNVGIQSSFCLIQLTPVPYKHGRYCLQMQ